MKKYVVEAMGAFFLVLTISLTGNPLAIGSMFAVLVYMGAHISGGHYNPAISLAVWLRGKLSGVDAIYYMLWQVFGAFLAGAMYFVLAGQRYFPMPAKGVVSWKIFIVEALFTTVLALTFLTVTTTKKLNKNYIYGLAIGFALLAISFLGGTYNPAVSLGTCLYDTFYLLVTTRTFGTAMMQVPMYVFGSFTGGIFAALIYRYINSDEFK